MVVRRMTKPIVRLDIVEDAALGWRPKVTAQTDEKTRTAQAEADRVAQELRSRHFLASDD